MFERFTERARQAVVLAQERAVWDNSTHVTSRHLLLGLLDEGEGIAAVALKAAGVTEAATMYPATVGPGPPVEEESKIAEGDERPGRVPPFTSAAKGCLESALRCSLALGHNYIGTEHLLLGMDRHYVNAAAVRLRELAPPAEAAFSLPWTCVPGRAPSGVSGVVLSALGTRPRTQAQPKATAAASAPTPEPIPIPQVAADALEALAGALTVAANFLRRL